MEYFRTVGTDPVVVHEIEDPVYVLRQRNGVIVRTPKNLRVQGIVSPDMREIWQLSGATSLGEEYSVVELITKGEYEEMLIAQLAVLPEEPEVIEPDAPENEEPDPALTRAQLTQKVADLEEAIELLISGEVE